MINNKPIANRNSILLYSFHFFLIGQISGYIKFTENIWLSNKFTKKAKSPKIPIMLLNLLQNNNDATSSINNNKNSHTKSNNDHKNSKKNNRDRKNKLIAII